MAKKNGFRNLNEEEVKLAVKALERTKSSIAIKTFLNNLAVCYTVDPEEKFTTCLLKQGGKKLFVGYSKRMTYGQMCDQPNSAVGNGVALTRAFRNCLTGTCSVDL